MTAAGSGRLDDQLTVWRKLDERKLKPAGDSLQKPGA
jgi:hypothetical protein